MARRLKLSAIPHFINISFQPGHHQVTIVKSLNSSIKRPFELSTNDTLTIGPEPNIEKPILNWVVGFLRSISMLATKGAKAQFCIIVQHFHL